MASQHIIASAGLSLVCKHCEISIQYPTALKISDARSFMRGFELMHRFCEKPVEPSSQLSIPAVTGEATCWLELWPQLEEALAPHEYRALVSYTAFPERVEVGSRDWQAMVRWVALEVADADGTLERRPSVLSNAIYEAVELVRNEHAKAAAEPGAKPRRKRVAK
jgi:hypothetical protein